MKNMSQSESLVHMSCHPATDDLDVNLKHSSDSNQAPYTYSRNNDKLQQKNQVMVQ